MSNTENDNSSSRRVVPAIELIRTDEERRDQELSWRRADDAFFAAGACHILAFTFAEMNPDSKIMFIRPTDDSIFGMHVFAVQDGRALDFNGWSDVGELIRVNLTACCKERPECKLEVIEINGDLETFCEQNRHRKPDEFFADPRPRARQYLKSLLGPADS